MGDNKPQSRTNGSESPSAHGKRPLAVGTSVPRFDAYAKVTGAEKFAADYYAENMVWAGVKRAGVPHARLKLIDTSIAETLPGVLRVLTHRDISGSNRQGVVRKDQPVLVDDKIRHCGDAVALVLAESKAALKKAIDSVRLDYDLLPGVFDVEQALEQGAPLVHEEYVGGNVLLHADLKVGKGADAEAECDLLLAACFRTQRQEHAYLETEAGWAFIETGGKLVIGCSTQTPFRDRAEVAEALGLNMGQVRIIAPYAGGAFGGKDGVTVQSLLGLAAQHSAGRPVKMWWDREESFVSGTKRHAARLYYRLGAKKDGTLHYLDVRLYYDTGPYDHLGGVVMTLALEHAGGPYRIPNAVLKGWSVYTNNPIGGAFRGFGVTQVSAAIEQMMGMLADRLSIDPIELRLKNGLNRGDRNCVGKTLVSSTGLIECLEVARDHPLWKERETWKSERKGFKRRGIGVAAVMQASGYGPVVPDYANAKLELTLEGKIRVYCGVADMGQGNASTSVQMAGSILTQDASQMELILPDTDRTLPSGSASASRCTYTFGNALIGAAEMLKNRLQQKAADLLMAGSREEFVLVPGAIRHLRTGKEIPLSTLAGFLQETERVVTHHFRAPVAGDDLGVPSEIRLHGLPHTLFSYSAHLACIEVDELTGAIDVSRYVAVSDCGSVLNPQIYEQQIHGGVGQGIGYALCEEFEVSEGTTLTPDLTTYIIPTALDVPEIESIPVEIYEHTGPFGLKGVGEVATNAPLPAVANALADACGVRIFQSPLTPERVLKALRDKNDQEVQG
jgi:CO/xanthine dehydrogenase Mo-binding subunit